MTDRPLPLVKLVQLRRHYKMGSNVVTAVDGVDLTIEVGEAVALIGPSGTGKSTLLNLIGGLDRPTSGEVWIDGKDIARATQRALVDHRKRQVGFVFQGFNLLHHRTALENVELPMILAGEPTSKRRKRAQELLDQVGLAKREGHQPSQLSGGEQQRVAIARALAMRPKILLADEPTGNLDSTTGKEVMELLSELNREGLTLILVTHDMNIASYAKRVVRMRDGRVERDDEVEQRTLAGTEGARV